MSYLVIPGASGIRAVRDLPPRRSVSLEEQLKRSAALTSLFLRAIMRRPTESVMVFSGERTSMSPEYIKKYDESRRDRRTNHERGKWKRKAMHKPRWRAYDKF